MTAAATISKPGIDWERVLEAAGIALIGIGVIASPFIAWSLGGLILTSLGFASTAWFAHLFIAWLVWTPLMGLLGALGAVIRGVFR